MALVAQLGTSSSTLGNLQLGAGASLIPPPPLASNTAPENATVISTLPYTNTVDAHDAGTTYDLWYTWTADFDGIISLRSYGGGDPGWISGDYFPYIEAFTQVDVPPDFLGDEKYLGPTAARVALILPVFTGVQYWFSIKELIASNPTPANHTLNISKWAGNVDAPIGSILSADQSSDVIGWAVCSGIDSDDGITYCNAWDGTIPLPATIAPYSNDSSHVNTERGAQLASGNMLFVQTFNYSTSEYETRRYDSQLTGLGTITYASIMGVSGNTSTVRVCAHEGQDCFYVLGNKTGAGSFTFLRRINPDGSLGTLNKISPATFQPAFSVKNDASVWYYKGAGDNQIKRWDIGLDSAMSDLRTSSGTSIIVNMRQMPDDSILALTRVGSGTSATYSLTRYDSSSGSQLTQVSVGTGWGFYQPPELVNSLTPSTTVWLRHGTYVRWKFREYRISDAVILKSVDHIHYQELQYGGNSDTPRQNPLGGGFGVRQGDAWFPIHVEIVKPAGPIDPPGVGLQHELSPGVWTDLCEDTVGGIDVRYGIQGSSPTDLIAGTGTMTYTLNNSIHNSAGLEGYYSPRHANLRSGFKFGMQVRLAIEFDGVIYYKFRGRLVEIDPLAGKYRQRTVRCVVTDWMDDFAEYVVRDVELQEDKRADQLLDIIINDMPAASQPPAKILDTGVDTFGRAFQDIRDGIAARQLASNIVHSELGLLVHIGDTIQGGTLRYFNRTFAATQASKFTFADDMHDVLFPATLDNVFNRIIVTYHPFSLDETIVLWSLTQEILRIEPQETREIIGTYVDENNETTGGTNGIAPVEVTDYLMNYQADGGGNPLQQDFSVDATFYAGSVRLLITNLTEDAVGFVTFLQVRGDRIGYESALTVEASSAQDYGQRKLEVDLPYQDDSVAAQQIADYLLSVYENPVNQVQALRLRPNRNDDFMTQALAREPGDRITLSETITGATAVGAIIRGVSLRLMPGADAQPIFDLTWNLAPSDAFDMWILDDAQASLLGQTTRPGF
jgi:hypothetical protein